MAAAANEGRDRARLRVGDEMVRREWGPHEMARRAGVDPGTITDFISGDRWPIAKNRSKISVAIGWPAEGIDMLVRGQEPATDHETVGAISQDAGVLLDMPPEALEGLGPAEREEIIAGAKQRALEIARELRRQLSE